MYFCAFGLVAFLPIAYLICQVLTFVVYEGRWRRWCLLPFPLVVAGFVPLLFWQTPVAVVVVTLAAPALGFLGLACVWGLYSKWAHEQRNRGAGVPAPAREATD